MRIAVASGKGGTGKTLVSTSLAWLLARDAHRVVYVDADVEEPNGHLFLHPELSDRQRYARPVPKLIGETCSGCGECQSFCQFNAILALRDRIMLFPELCSSCGGCVLACPDDVLTEVPREIGIIEAGTACAEAGRPIRFLSATLDVGEARATPLIRGLLDRIEDPGIVLIDAPPGTSCSVMEIVSDVDLVVMVTEPTPFGLHDLTLAVEMTRALGKPITAVVNRSDLGNGRVQQYLASQQIEVAAEIPFRLEGAGPARHPSWRASPSSPLRRVRWRLPTAMSRRPTWPCFCRARTSGPSSSGRVAAQGSMPRAARSADCVLTSVAPLRSESSIFPSWIRLPARDAASVPWSVPWRPYPSSTTRPACGWNGGPPSGPWSTPRSA